MTNKELIDAVVDLLSQYDGKIAFGVQSILFKSGLFVLEVDLKPCGSFPYSISCEFGHNEGCSCPCFDLLDLKKTVHEYMKRYHIKQQLQLSLFDFAY